MKLTKNKEDIENKRDIIKKAILQRLENSFFLDNKDEEKNIKINRWKKCFWYIIS